MYDLVIVGGGPGGVAAGVYAARKKMKTALVAEAFGGQSLVSADIQNWIGTKSISGFDFGQALEAHLRAQADIEIISGDLVERIEEAPGGLVVRTKQGKTLETKYVLLASGSRRRKINVPGEARLEGKGVAYCSICDAPLFGGKDVAVVGGGNAGLEAVLDLIPYAAKIYLLERNGSLRGDQVTQEKIKANPKVETILGAETTEILGDTSVTGLHYNSLPTGEKKELALGGVFIEIGAIPSADFVKGMVAMNELGEVIADPRTQVTSHSRIYGVGDVSDVRYKQNNISAGDAVKAVLHIYETLQKSGE